MVTEHDSYSEAAHAAAKLFEQGALSKDPIQQTYVVSIDAVE